MPTLYEQIGQQIRERRMALKLSQEALAAKLDVAPNTISRWETGTYKVTPEDLDKLAREFKISVSTFFPGLPEEEARAAALTSAIGGLDKSDIDEVIRYAEFRKARRALESAKRPRKKS
jgi:transcriptional regulator with XRE-family HTH domain